MFCNSLALVVRNLSLILRLNISLNSKCLILPVLELPFNSDLSIHFLGFYPFDTQIATYSFFTILLDFVFLLLISQQTNLIWVFPP